MQNGYIYFLFYHPLIQENIKKYQAQENAWNLQFPYSFRVKYPYYSFPDNL